MRKINLEKARLQFNFNIMEQNNINGDALETGTIDKAQFAEKIFPDSKSSESRKTLYSNLERGLMNVKLELIDRIVKVSGISYNELLQN